MGFNVYLTTVENLLIYFGIASDRIATDEVFDMRCHGTDLVLRHITQFIDVLSRDDKDLGIVAANLE